jgi:hypothetical protein
MSIIVKSGNSGDLATVKSGSTAPLASDPALVVSVSPNSPAQSVSGTVTSNQGTPNTAANSWPVEVTDGTNVLGTASHPLKVDPTGTTPQPVSQNGAPWSENVTQFGGTNISTGTGASGAGIPRVTVSNDSKVIAWDGTNTTTVKPASTPAAAADTALVVALSPNTPLPAGTHNVGSVDIDSFAPGTQDVFGTLVTGFRQLQINIQFNVSAALSNLVTLTTSGTGAGTITGGQAQFSTGTGATAQSTGVTTAFTAYAASCETYSIFSVAFTTPTSASSYQKIGLYDANNGFYVGYIGTSFGITKRSAGVDVTVPQASWNVDTLTGGSTSQFTRNGTPEAINFATSNIFRIRFGWLGSSPIYYEVLSPDGEWVTFHKILQPNTTTLPSIQNPNLPMTLDVSKTASDATNLIMYTGCWGAGTVSGVPNVQSSGSVAATNGVVELTRNNTIDTMFQLLGTWSGSIVCEGSIDNINWYTLYFIQTGSTSTNFGPITSTTINSVYEVICPAAYNYVRVRGTGWVSGTALVYFSSVPSTSTIETTIGPSTPGNAAPQSLLVGGLFTTALPSLGSGQQAAIPLDSSSRPIIAPLTSTSTVTVVQPTAANLNATVTQQTLTKGTQGATGVTVQELKDAGRNVSTLFMTVPVVTTATDTLQSLTGYKSGAAVGATTTPAVVTAGKTYRVTSITMTYVGITTAGTATFTLRANTGGVVAIGSPAVGTWVVGTDGATAGFTSQQQVDFPDGLEFAAGTGIGVSVIGRGATQTAAAVGYAHINIYGYEY